MEKKTGTPLNQIRQYCLHHCMNHQTLEVIECPTKNCVFYDLRDGTNPKRIKSVLKQIKSYCADCSDGSKKIKKCDFIECALFVYRLGKNPNLKGKRKNNLPVRDNHKINYTE